jgi:hypothetical protein
VNRRARATASRRSVPARPGACYSVFVSSQEPSEIAARLRLALDLFAAGEEMKRQSLRRSHPEATEAEIEAMLFRWLRERPGSEAGDAPGRSLPVPE